MMITLTLLFVAAFFKSPLHQVIHPQTTLWIIIIKISFSLDLSQGKATLSYVVGYYHYTP